MIALPSLDAAERAVLSDAQRLVAIVRAHAAREPETVAEALALLSALRSETYEDLNQIQHEHCIIRGARWLLKEGIVDDAIRWSWNPRQTGTGTEPDLSGDAGQTRVVSAEITTSVNPVVKIDERMGLYAREAQRDAQTQVLLRVLRADEDPRPDKDSEGRLGHRRGLPRRRNRPLIVVPRR
jgi:hypothetical protein